MIPTPSELPEGKWLYHKEVRTICRTRDQKKYKSVAMILTDNEQEEQILCHAKEMWELLKGLDWEGMLHEERQQWDADRQALLREIEEAP